LKILCRLDYIDNLIIFSGEKYFTVSW